MKTNLMRTRSVIFLCFVLVFLSLGRIQLVAREELSAHPANRYTIAKETGVKRGEIFDRNGLPLAQWNEEGRRYYPLSEAGSHPLGYVSKTLGSTGVEAWFMYQLLGQDGSLALKNFWQRLAGGQEIGYDIQLTIDATLQKYSYSLLGGKKGAIVALDPGSGEILAMVSSPGFNPNDLENRWDQYVENVAQPLFNRAVSGAYPPGSTFKLVVAAAALESDPSVWQRKFECPGYIEVEGRRLACYTEHGELNFLEGIAYSCNVVFAGLGLELGEEQLRKQASAFGFDQEQKFDVPVRNSSLGEAPLTVNGLAESSIGQGKVLSTPLQMALVTAAVANEGLLPEPFLLKARSIPGKDEFVPVHAISQTRVMTRQTAQMLKKAMVDTVNYGTGWQAQLTGIQVGGKTGSAENPHGQAHAWFVGFAPAETPEIAVAVVVENAGSGGGHGGPIARDLIDYYLSLP